MSTPKANMENEKSSKKNSPVNPEKSSGNPSPVKDIQNQTTPLNTTKPGNPGIVNLKSTPRQRQRLPSESQSNVQTLFDHLPKAHDKKSLFETPINPRNKSIPIHDPIFHTLGLKYAEGIIRGSNSRTVALLDAIRHYLEIYVTPEGKEFKFAFGDSLKSNLKFLRLCRPFAVAMDNAVEFVNQKCHGETERTEVELRKELLESIEDFEDAIEKAKEAIVQNSEDKIMNGDTILIYGYSEVVWRALVAAAERKTFSIVVIGSRPHNNEKKGTGLDIIANLMDKKLEKSITSLTYTSIAGLSNVLGSVSKVFLGAHALLTNGSVLAKTGSSQIALMATAFNIPVLVCCETYKFCDKSPTDSFFHNELDSSFGPFVNGKNQRNVGGGAEELLTDGIAQVNLEDDALTDGFLLTPVIKYDVTPPELVTAVVTDVDILPCTSVPVVLRVQENRKHGGKTV